MTIANRLGLHARPAMSFVDTANAFQSTVRVFRTDRGPDSAVDAKSIMQVMMLAATEGTELTVVAEGDDAPQMLEALSKLVESKFGED
jgi:phosphocarrier protein HPr